MIGEEIYSYPRGQHSKKEKEKNMENLQLFQDKSYWDATGKNSIVILNSGK